MAAMKGISNQPGSMVRSRSPLVSDVPHLPNAIRLGIAQLHDPRHSLVEFGG